MTHTPSPGASRNRAEGVLRLRATPFARAAECLVELVGAPNVRSTIDLFEISVDREHAASINTQLVRAGVRVSELTWHTLRRNVVAPMPGNCAEVESWPADA